MKRLVNIAATVLLVFFASAMLPLPVEAAQTLNVNTEQVFFMPAPAMQQYQVIEVLSVHNSSRVSLPVRLNIPSGALDVSVLGFPKAQPDKQGIMTLPGAARANQVTNVTVSFIVSWTASQASEITLVSDYPVYMAHLYLPIGNQALSAEGLLTTTQTVQISNTTFRVFTRPGIGSGEQWTISLQELPSASGNQQAVKGLALLGDSANGQTNQIQAISNLLLALFILTVGLVGVRARVIPGRRGRLSREESLLRGWEVLEANYQAGRVGKEDYQTRREQIKRQLVRLKLENGSSGS